MIIIFNHYHQCEWRAKTPHQWEGGLSMSPCCNHLSEDHMYVHIYLWKHINVFVYVKSVLTAKTNSTKSRMRAVSSNSSVP